MFLKSKAHSEDSHRAGEKGSGGGGVAVFFQGLIALNAICLLTSTLQIIQASSHE